MPIQFRCKHCQQMLSISSRKMGATVNCPACSEPILVPGEAPATQSIDTVKAALPLQPVAPQSPTTAAAPPVTTTAKATSAITPVAPATKPPFSEPDTRSAASVSPFPVAAVTAPPRKLEPPAATKPTTQSAANLWADEEEDEDAPRGVRQARIANDGLDMTPMVDVTFQLLIFFMITASFVTQKSLQTTPPEPNDDTGAVTVQLEDMQDQSVIVNIDSEGAMLVDDVPVEGVSALVETLMGKMAAEQKTELLIEADYNAKHGAIIQVIDAGITAGMQNIRKTSRQDE